MNGSRPILLVLDYPGRRDEPALSTMGLEADGFDVRYLLASPPARELHSAAYARRLAADHGPFDTGVTWVLAYCMAGSIAQDLARLLSESSAAPVPIILLDGEPATAATITGQYSVVATQLLEQLGADGTVAVPAGTFDAALLRDQPAVAVDRMRQGLTRLAVEAIGRDLGDPIEAAEVAEQLSDVYVDWLVHLVAAYNTVWPYWGGDVLHFLSRDHWFRQGWPGARHTELVLTDCHRNDLASDAAVRARIVAQLAGGQRPAAPGVTLSDSRSFRGDVTSQVPG